MKKRFLTIGLVLILSLSLLLLAGCGNSNNTNDGGNNSQGKMGKKTEAFFNMFNNGTYHMKAKMDTASGVMEMEIYTKNGMSASLINAEGESIRVIVKDNKSYMIVDSEKMIMVSDVTEDESSGVLNTAGMNYIGSGEAMFGGKNRYYEEYAGDDGEKIQFFLDGNTLVGIRSLNAGETGDMEILELNKNVPDNVFDIPSDYQQVSF